MPAPPPFGEAGTGEFHCVRRGIRPRVKVKVVIHLVTLVLPIAAQQIARIEIDNVVGEDKGDVLLLARAHKLVLFAEGEDVVAKNVVAPVMLVKTGALATINHVVLQHDVGAAFVRV